MLKSEDAANEQTTVPAGQARVTPEELSKAIAAIEARKQAEANRLAGTIPLQEAVSGLHLDSTPEEIWSEVQSQRVKATAPDPQSFAEADAARREQLRRTQIAPSASQIWPFLRLNSRLSGRPKKRWMKILTPILLIWVLVESGIGARIHFHHTGTTPSVMQSLAQIPDGKEVYADNTALIQASEGKPISQITVYENEDKNQWAVEKIKGHLYLRGYIPQTDSLSSLQNKPLNVYNDDNSGELENERTSNITLRIDKIPLQKSGGDEDFSEVTVPNFQPDPLTTLSPWR